MAAALDGQLRIAILRLLTGAARYSATDDLLHAALDSMHHRVSVQRVRAEMRWLAGSRLVEVDDYDGGIAAKLTDRGQAVAEGRATAEGVAPLRPDLIV